MKQEMNELLVPQIIVDLSRDYLSNKNPIVADTYKQRLESIRDYCNLVLEQDKKHFSTVNKNKNFKKRNRS